LRGIIGAFFRHYDFIGPRLEIGDIDPAEGGARFFEHYSLIKEAKNRVYRCSRFEVDLSWLAERN
jgi:hypothetical protein